jgi:hypothetical protein
MKIVKLYLKNMNFCKISKGFIIFLFGFGWITGMTMLLASGILNSHNEKSIDQYKIDCYYNLIEYTSTFNIDCDTISYNTTNTCLENCNEISRMHKISSILFLIGIVSPIIFSMLAVYLGKKKRQHEEL